MDQSLPTPLPPNDTPIWRYMSLEKFRLLLDGSALWFSRIRRFDDLYEGTFSVPATVANSTLIALRGNMTGYEAYRFSTGLLSALNAISRMCCFANCWCGFSSESRALWDLYGQGVAIQSTIGRLKRCLEPHRSREVAIGSVGYVEDPEAEVTADARIVKAVLTKRLAYQHEHEIRAYFFHWPPEEYLADLSQYAIPAGFQLTVDLGRLIERVVIAPDQSDDFKLAVESDLSQASSRHGFRPKPVEWSRLRGTPEFFSDPERFAGS